MKKDKEEKEIKINLSYIILRKIFDLIFDTCFSLIRRKKKISTVSSIARVTENWLKIADNNERREEMETGRQRREILVEEGTKGKIFIR